MQRRCRNDSRCQVRFSAHITLGLDGNLYALRHNNLFIDVYDPLTNALIRTIELDLAIAVGDIRGVSVDSSGLLYLAGWNGSIYQADSDGNFMSSLVTGFNNLTDIDINNSGNLLAGTFSGDVIFSDTSLSPVTSFTIPSSTMLSVHVSFTDPLLVQEASVPEPTSLALLGLSACGFGVAARRRRKVARRSDPLRDGRE